MSKTSWAFSNAGLICSECGFMMDMSVSVHEPVFEGRAKCNYKKDCPNHGKIFRIVPETTIRLEEIVS